MKRTQNELDAKQVLSVIENYNTALTLLNDYDHECMKRPKGSKRYLSYLGREGSQLTLLYYQEA